MKTTSTDQRFALLAALGTNTNWDALAVEEVQVGITEGQRAGAEFTQFVKNGFRIQVGDFFRDTGELTLKLPALRRPTLAELQAKFSFIKSIERDTSPVEAVTFNLATVLGDGENSINGAEYERRITPKRTIILGYQHAAWLMDRQKEYPDLMGLLGKIYIDFSGLVVVRGSGRRDYPYLGQNDKLWFVSWSWVDSDFSRDGRVAISSK